MADPKGLPDRDGEDAGRFQWVSVASLAALAPGSQKEELRPALLARLEALGVWSAPLAAGRLLELDNAYLYVLMRSQQLLEARVADDEARRKGGRGTRKFLDLLPTVDRGGADQLLSAVGSEVVRDSAEGREPLERLPLFPPGQMAGIRALPWGRRRQVLWRRVWNLATYLFPDEAPAVADRLCDELDLGIAAGDEAEPYLIELCRAADAARREQGEQTWRFSAGPSGARPVPSGTRVVLGALGQRQHRCGELEGLYPREKLAYVPDCWACGRPIGKGVNGVNCPSCRRPVCTMCAGQHVVRCDGSWARALRFVDMGPIGVVTAAEATFYRITLSDGRELRCMREEFMTFHQVVLTQVVGAVVTEGMDMAELEGALGATGGDGGSCGSAVATRGDDGEGGDMGESIRTEPGLPPLFDLALHPMTFDEDPSEIRTEAGCSVFSGVMLSDAGTDEIEG